MGDRLKLGRRSIGSRAPLLRRALLCESRRSLVPSFLAVNFYSLDDVLRVADTLNGVPLVD